jgi:hypothetical protein
MSFCWNCGTALPDLFDTTAKTQEMSVQLASNTPTVESTHDMKTIEANRFIHLSTPLPVEEPPKSKTFLIIGGIAGLLILGLITVAGVVVYNLIPPKNNVVNVVTTPTATATAKSTTPTQKPTPDTSFTPPVEPTKEGTFTVQANTGWQLSELATVANEQFSTTVGGKIDLAGIKNDVAATGVNDAKTKFRRIYPEFPTGALLMRTRYADGKYSNVVPLLTNGSNGNWENYPDERGKIEFCINDNSPENNSGSFTVKLKFNGIAKPKTK